MGVIAGPRTEELGRSSSGSAFAPYAAGSTAAAAAAAAFSGASPPGYGSASSHLAYGADAAAAAAAAAAFSSYVVSEALFVHCDVFVLNELIHAASDISAHTPRQLIYYSLLIV